MSTYNNIFNGSVINPATVSYKSYTLDSANLLLDWPILYQSSNDIVASYIDITSNDNAYTVQMPDATETSVGQVTVFSNVGANEFSIIDNDGGSIQAAIASTTSYLLVLTDNSTSAGTWSTLQFGATTSSANAAQLAGFGLIAQAAKLNVDVPVTSVVGPVAPVNADRAKLYIWTGGPNTFTLPDAATVGNGWFVRLNNQSSSSGVVTVQGASGETINGQASFLVGVQESSMFISDGTNYYTDGYGNNTISQVAVLEKDVSAGGTILLTAEEASRQIMRFFGALPGNTIVEVPAIENFYYVYNNTTNAFSLTFKMNGGATNHVIPQSQTQTFFCDTVDMRLGDSIFTGSGFFDPGSAAAPSIVSTADSTTGFFFSAPSNVDISTSGVQRVNFNDTGIKRIAGTVGNPSLSYLTDTDTGIYSVSANIQGFAAGGVLAFQHTNNSIQILDGAVGTPSLRFISENTGFYLSAPNSLSVSINGILYHTFTTTYFDTPSLRVGNGLVATPSLSFSSDTDTGLYLSAANEISLASTAEQIVKANRSTFSIGTGTSGNLPQYGFLADATTYVELSAANELNLVTNSTTSLKLTNTAVDSGEDRYFSFDGINIESIMAIKS